MPPTVEPEMTAQIAAADVGLAALQRTPVIVMRERRRILVFIMLAVLAYCIGFVAGIPARFGLSPSERVRVGGTIWNGQAAVGQGLHLDWHLSPLASLAHPGFGVNWHLTGGATDLAGSASMGRHSLRLENVSGEADGALLDVAAPHLPFGCHFLAQVSLERAQIGGDDQYALGGFRSSPVSCSARAIPASSLSLPSLSGDFHPEITDRITSLSKGMVATSNLRQDLIEVRLTSHGALSIWPTATLTARAPLLTNLREDTVLKW